ncbi:MAG: hypothetical protein R3B99_16555 [Polyangiales bacterium]
MKYLLAVCAKRHSIEKHEVVLMSSHLHALHGLARAAWLFFDFHAMLARCNAAAAGLEAAGVRRRQTNQPVVVTVQGAVEAAAYTSGERGDGGSSWRRLRSGRGT